MMAAGRHEAVHFDVIVVGSGPGAVGFLLRLLELCPGASVGWFEEGGRNHVVAWPDEYPQRERSGDMRPHPFATRPYLKAFSWHAFGGGDAMHSGGPNRLGLRVPSEPYDAVDVLDLRGQSVCAASPLGDRFLQSLREAGFDTATTSFKRADSGAQPVKPGRAGYTSSIYASDRGSRLPLADTLVGRVAALHLSTTVLRVLMDEQGGHEPRACGVVTRTAGKEEVTYTADKVVLACGVFGTFSLLVDSGIGPAAALEARNVPAVVVNESVGQGIGDEHVLVLLFVAAERQDLLHRGQGVPVVAAEEGDSSVQLVVWTRGVAVIIKVLVRLPWILRCFACLIYAAMACLLGSVSFMSISLDSPPFGRLVATETSVKLDDSSLELTPQMLSAYQSILPPVERFLELNRQATTGWRRRVARLLLWMLTPFFRLFPPHGLTEFHLPKIVRRKNLASYQHLYGGCGPGVLDLQYRVRGVGALHVADASVLTRLTPGAPSPTIMEEGMRVADAIFLNPSPSEVRRASDNHRAKATLGENRLSDAGTNLSCGMDCSSVDSTEGADNILV